MKSVSRGMPMRAIMTAFENGDDGKPWRLPKKTVLLSLSYQSSQTRELTPCKIAASLVIQGVWHIEMIETVKVSINYLVYSTLFTSVINEMTRLCPIISPKII
jgi:hypothetical protein